MTEDDRKQRKCPPIHIKIENTVTKAELEAFQAEIERVLIDALRPPFQVKIPYSTAGEALLKQMFLDTYNRLFPNGHIDITVVIEK